MSVQDQSLYSKCYLLTVSSSSVLVIFQELGSSVSCISVELKCSVLVNKLVLCAWLLSGTRESLRLGMRIFQHL